MRKFFADVRVGGDFLKTYWAKRYRKQNLFLFHVLHGETACVTVIFKTFGLTRLSRILLHTNHESSKFHSFTCNCVTIQLTVRAWLHEPGLLALPRWLLSGYYMNRASPGKALFLYRDWKQYAWVVCYPLSCFSLGLFARFPGKRE